MVKTNLFEISYTPLTKIEEDELEEYVIEQLKDSSNRMYTTFYNSEYQNCSCCGDEGCWFFGNNL